VIFADTSFLLSLAGNDSNSPVAVTFAKSLNAPIQITTLNRLEFDNAVHLLRFRGVLAEKEASAALAAFATDEQAGRIQEFACDWLAVFNEALRLSRARSLQEGHRLLDILHVAAALKSGAKQFVSFDQRQRGLALAEGLAVVP
jgi:predicted nucleic acid-binding protein